MPDLAPWQRTGAIPAIASAAALPAAPTGHPVWLVLDAMTLYGWDGAAWVPLAGAPGPAGYAAAVLALGPAQYLALDSLTGLTDLSGNGRHGAAEGDDLDIGADEDSPAAIGGGSTLFDGSNDYISTTYNPFEKDAARTFTGWAKLLGFGGNWLVAQDTGSAANFELFVEGSTGTVQLIMPDGHGTEVEWNSLWPTDNSWVHWALVFDDAADEQRLYLNGEDMGPLPNEGQFADSPGNLTWGGAPVFWFTDGKLAHVAAFERALDAGEIAGLYEAAQ